jgi:hypothetical protein
MNGVGGKASTTTRHRPAAVLVAAAATAAAIAMPAFAHAAPHWLADGKLVTRPLKVNSSLPRESLTFNFSPPGAGSITCTVIEKQIVIDPSGGEAGTGELRAFSARTCEPEDEAAESLCGEEFHVDPVGLPWRSHLALEPPAPGVRDVLEGVGIEVRCTKLFAKGGKGGRSLGVYKGTLNAKVGTNVLEFEGGGGLTGGEAGPLTFKGANFLKPSRKAKALTAG